MFSVYAIYNPKHRKIYIGQTADLEKRLKLHNDKRFKNSFTARFDGNWILVHAESFESRLGALVREKQLKSYRGRQFIKKLI